MRRPGTAKSPGRAIKVGGARPSKACSGSKPHPGKNTARIPREAPRRLWHRRREDTPPFLQHSIPPLRAGIGTLPGKSHCSQGECGATRVRNLAGSASDAVLQHPRFALHPGGGNHFSYNPAFAATDPPNWPPRRNLQDFSPASSDGRSSRPFSPRETTTPPSISSRTRCLN